ncbi:hypothetical protein T261_6737 [Streptomyces lydicus]|nr:hypothetical protein T261_6737 [Streptomyces lydicus]
MGERRAETVRQIPRRHGRHRAGTAGTEQARQVPGRHGIRYGMRGGAP